LLDAKGIEPVNPWPCRSIYTLIDDAKVDKSLNFFSKATLFL
jgi:hypothetical protein